MNVTHNTFSKIKRCRFGSCTKSTVLRQFLLPPYDAQRTNPESMRKTIIAGSRERGRQWQTQMTGAAIDMDAMQLNTIQHNTMGGVILIGNQINSFIPA
jgi:hypothetical protein